MNEFVKNKLPKRIKNSNKGTYGKVLNIAGSENYSGAALLSSIAALKVGAGYVTLASSKKVIERVASMNCDITFLELSNKIFEEIKDYDVFSIGCGLSQCGFAKDFLCKFLQYFKNSDKKFVFDADALNIISKMDNVIFPKNSVITPHPKELARLLGVESVLDKREYFLKKAIEKFNCAVVLKGYNTLIGVKKGEVHQNQTGNSALAKAGTGDVLTGMIAGLCAQGLEVETASILAVYLHGLSGDLYAKDFSEYSMLASDLLNYIPKALKEVLFDV